MKRRLHMNNEIITVEHLYTISNKMATASYDRLFSVFKTCKTKHKSQMQIHTVCFT